MRFLSLPLFSAVFGIGYALAVFRNVTPFRYYPLVSRWSLTDLADKSLGPAMTWYGWIAAGLVPGLVIGVLGSFLPERIRERLWPLVWVAPVLMLAAGFVRERSWIGG